MQDLVKKDAINPDHYKSHPSGVERQGETGKLSSCPETLQKEIKI